MPFKRLLKSTFTLSIFFIFLLPGFASSSDSEQTPIADYQKKIAELDVAIARLVEQKQELAGKIETLEENSTQNSNQAWKDPLLGIDFVWVPEGCFRMGDRRAVGDQDELPAHKVCLDGFYMGKFEVTQAQYIKVMRKNPSSLKSSNGYPVESVSWKEANVFLARLNKFSKKKMRLPTEAEWEYAARSGDKRYQFAGSDEANEVAWSQLNDASIIHKIGLKNQMILGYMICPATLVNGARIGTTSVITQIAASTTHTALTLEAIKFIGVGITKVFLLNSA